MARLIKKVEDKKQPSSSDALRSAMSDKDNKGYIYNDIRPKNKRFSFGSIKVDSALTLRSGQVIRMVAKQPESGKSSASLVLAENYMKEMGNAKTLYVKAEGRLSKELQARSGMKFVDNVDEWETGTVFVLSCNVFEIMAKTIISVLKTAHANEEYIAVIIDSMDGLILQADLDKGFEGNTKVAGVPLLTKLLFRHLALPVAHYDALLIVIGQYAAAIQIDPYAENVPRQASSSGGSSIGHQSDHVLEFQPRYGGSLILKDPNNKKVSADNPIIGYNIKIIPRKSANDITGIPLEYPIKKGVVGCAIWKSREIVEMLQAFEMIKQGGAWFSWPEDVFNEAKEAGVELVEKIQGINSVYSYFEENINVMEYFEKRIKELIGIEEEES